MIVPAPHPDQLSLHALALPWPPDWPHVFGRTAPLVLEIGFGHARFLTDLARQHPGWNLIGLERAHAPLAWAEETLQKQSLPNIRLVNGEGLMALHCLFEPASLARVYINFSDPWHKKRHRKRRLITPEFLATLATRLQPGGDVYIATDIAQYAGEIGLALARTPGLRNAYPTPWMSQREGGVLTHYERKALREGRPCHYFRYVRDAKPLPALPVYEELAMPNATLHLPLDADAIGAAFEPHSLQTRQGERISKVMHVYQEPDQAVLMFETVIEEPLFSQRLMLKLLRHASGEWGLGAGAVGYPRATAGLHDAVRLLVDWLVSLHPEAHIIQHTLRPPDAD
ncbi:MAG: tRNA (guanosine(46)-N7)-methyltransferase TrmB [Anaerolineales bacterium]